AWSGAGCSHWNRNVVALLRRQLKRLRPVPFKFGGTIGDGRDIVVTGRAFDIIELDLYRPPVVRAQKARERRSQHNWIAHNHVANRLADLVLAPRYSHQADGPGEARNIELHLGNAIATNGDNAGVKRKRRLRWR